MAAYCLPNDEDCGTIAGSHPDVLAVNLIPRVLRGSRAPWEGCGRVRRLSVWGILRQQTWGIKS
jgi:hypothetical protein